MNDKRIDALVSLLIQKKIITEKELEESLFSVYETSRLNRELAYRDR